MVNDLTTTQVSARTKLLDAAGAVFADAGFRGATVRDICKHAGMNIASIKYHFGDKESLYAEVLRTAYTQALEKFPATLGVSAESTAEEKLHAFILAFLSRILDAGRPTWHGRLMAREIVEPSFAFDAMIRDVIRPDLSVLLPIVSELLSRHAADPVSVAPDEITLRLCVRSIIGQCLFYLHAREVLKTVESAHAPAESCIERLANHVADFSLGGIRAFVSSASSVTPPSEKTQGGE